MKKTLCALAIGATLFIPALAMAADIDIYGRAHVSMDYLDNGNNYNEVGLSSNASRLGFKVEQEINDSFTAFAQIEQEVNFSSGSQDSKGVDFATRDTFAGVKGDFGQVRVGRFDSPFKAARGPVNFFGDQVGDLRNVARVGDARFDERNENTIEYKSPKLGPGIIVTGALSLHESTSPDQNADKDKAYDIAVAYKAGAVDLAAAYEHYEENRDKGERDGIRLAGAYKIIPDLNLGAFYQYTTLDNPGNKPLNEDAHVFGVAADYKLAAKTYIRGQVFHRNVDADDANATLIAAAIEQRFDNQFRVYGNLATVLNDEKSNLTPWAQGRSNVASGSAGDDAVGLSVGMRYDF